VDLGQRLRLRDLLLGDDDARRDELDALLSAGSDDPEIAPLIADVAPLVAQLHEAVDEHLPFGTPREAVDYALDHAGGFSVAAVAEHCGAQESRGGEEVDEVRRLLAEEVQAGRLSVEYVFDCPSCGNIIDDRRQLPAEPFRVFCGYRSCCTRRTIDPATAHAIFVNAEQAAPALEIWI
jgi:hypothetical protein